MSNMAYCRFRNTLSYLLDCYGALGENGIDDLSKEEKKAAIELISMCADIAADFIDLLTDDET